MDSKQFLHICRNYQRQWAQLCVNPHGISHNRKLSCSLIKKILFDCKGFHTKKYTKQEDDLYLSIIEKVAKE
jgi:hypothetical protein